MIQTTAKNKVIIGSRESRLAVLQSEIVGGRINERYKITSETGRVLEITYQGGNVQ